MTKQRILIAEDDPSILKVTKLRLEHEGYEVTTAVDGAEALQRATAELPNLILMDVLMPKLNGYDVCRTLKQQPATARIPVVVFSASVSQMQYLADRCIEVGATDWIRKPFRTKDLLMKIDQALGRTGKEGESHG